MDASDGQKGLWTDLPRMEGGGPSINARRPPTGPGMALAPELAAALRNPDGVLFLDIETTGLSLYYDELTLVGYGSRGCFETFVVGDDPEGMLRTLASAEVLVTFNGKQFDVPFIRKTFGEVGLPRHHLDLRYAARRVGLAGGQKAIEVELGLRLREGLSTSDGAAAVLLWHRYLRGDLDALRELLAYNEADVRGMRAILDHVLAAHGAAADLLSDMPTFSADAIPYRSASRILPDPTRLARGSPTFDDVFDHAAGARVVGIDLTGSAARRSGVAVLVGRDVETALVATDDELVAAVVDAAPDLVSIDSPLSLPRGRATPWDDDPTRATHGIMRLSERTLKRRGINVYPCLLPSMQRLTARGMVLSERLRGLGIPVIESYPGAAQDIMGIPRKGAGKEWLAAGLAHFGLRGAFSLGRASHDELDAITSALVGTFFLEGRYEALGGPGENALIVPMLQPTRRGVVVAISGPICAGKTTAGRLLERKGYRYARFSMVIDDELRARGVAPDRVSRQALGMEIHATLGQAWLCERVSERLGNAPLAVIDGVRWLEDKAFLAERYGPNLLHIHLVATAAVRAGRYRAEPGQGRPFEEAEAQPVEQAVAALAEHADVVLANDSSLADFERNVECVVDTHADKAGGPCPLP